MFAQLKVKTSYKMLVGSVACHVGMIFHSIEKKNSASLFQYKQDVEQKPNYHA